jgi:hypothetical protein
MKARNFSFFLLLLFSVAVSFTSTSCKKKLCTDTCAFNNDGQCDDGGEDSDFDVCELGTDCADCGERDR